MISDTVIHNLVAGSAQLVLIVTGAALLERLVRVDAAGVRYFYWRAIAALCVVLPWIQSYQPAGRQAPAAGTGTVEVVAAGVSAAAASPIGHTDWAAIAALAIAAGAGGRLLWIAGGFMTLRRLRGEAAPVTACAPGSDLQQTLGTHAEIRYAAHLAHPVTFGVRRPVVLLPDSLRARPADIQRAVLAHELLHVQRRDWAWLVVEEIARAALWFQPAAWWLISRIQLAREEVVDEMAVMVTGRRRIYVEALLACSDSTSLVPTAAFARRRHLFRRIGLVSREVDMSSGRIVSSCAFMAAIVAAGSWYAVSAFPLQQQHSMEFVPAPQGAPGPLEQRANPITPENPIPRRLTTEAMFYPAEAAAVQAGGQMTLQITLDDLGRVAEARPIHFGITSPVMELSSSGSAARFAGGTEMSSAVGNENFRESLKSTVLRNSGKSAPMLDVYDAIARAAADAARQWRYDPPFKAPISFPVTFRFGPEPAPTEMGTQVVPAGSASNDGALRVGEAGITAPKKITDVRPVYPAVARAANVQGVVIIEARIEPDGSVSDAKVIKSIPLLDQAALDAVKQWRFTPPLLNGQPAAVVMATVIHFSLDQSEPTGAPAPPVNSPSDTANLAPSWAPYWSPDRSKLAFFSNRDGKSEMYVVNRDGSGLRKVTDRSGQK
jgi:TonB family protein